MRVVVGRIGKAHGIRGEVTVEVRTDEPDRRFRPGTTLLTQDGTPLIVEDVREHGSALLVRFRGTADRNAAESLRGTLLEVDVDPDEVPEDDDEYYDRQLEGLRAVHVGGELLGTVHEVLHLPGHDLLAVRTPDGREVLVPFVREIVTAVDVPGGAVTIDPPGGLFDEAEE